MIRRIARGLGPALLAVALGLSTAACEDPEADSVLPGGGTDDAEPLDPGEDPERDGGDGRLLDGGDGAGGAAGAGAGGAAGGGEGGGGGEPEGPVEVEPCVQTVTIDGIEVFAYEASRVDATAEEAGFDESGGLCSQPGVLPWTGLPWPDASRTCMAHGFRLCTNDEWQAICQAGRVWPFPFGEAYEGGLCNDHVSGSGALLPTGSYPGCRTPEGVYDLSGNVWEVTADSARRGASWKINAVMFRVDSARCDVFYDITEGFTGDDVGFRCCR